MGPWTLSGNGKRTLSFYDENEKKIVEIVMDKDNAFMLACSLLDARSYYGKAKKENITVSLW